jgi:putative DNA primase/helicase
LFDKWLNDVFAPEDIPTVQEIMGYCLVPTTAAGEAFFIVGDGEAGKSGLGTILMGILGKASVSVETQQLVTKQFQVADVEHKLLAYDDDLGSAALTETGLLKKLITADTPIRAERKYADAHQFNSYCRILASANFMLSSLYDDSNGFYRRLHPILVKPKQPNRKVINKFYEIILEQEKEQIFKWALIGLKRLMENGWKISWSERSRNYLKANKSSAVHFEDFFNETCVVAENETTTTADLVKLYKKWCKENGIKEASDRRLSTWFADNSERIGINRSETIMREGRN